MYSPLSNSLNSRRDLAILYNRVAILSLAYCLLNDYFDILFIETALGLNGGLSLTNDITLVLRILELKSEFK